MIHTSLSIATEESYWLPDTIYWIIEIGLDYIILNINYQVVVDLVNHSRVS